MREASQSASGWEWEQVPVSEPAASGWESELRLDPVKALEMAPVPETSTGWDRDLATASATALAWARG
jgi:hypothetical protein